MTHFLKAHKIMKKIFQSIYFANKNLIYINLGIIAKTKSTSTVILLCYSFQGLLVSQPQLLAII